MSEGKNKVMVQVALDLTDLDKALFIARICSELGYDIIEAGTPLIKKYGIEHVVSRLRNVVGERPIFVDTKTFDAPRVEAEIVSSSGGNIFSIMALAPIDAIQEAYEASRDLGVKLLIDLMNVSDPIEYSKSLIREHNVVPDILCLHVGLSTQMRRGVNINQMLSLVRSLRNAVPENVSIAVAGGIKKDTAPLYASAGANIIIIGGAITRSPDPRTSAMEILRSLSQYR